MISIDLPVEGGRWERGTLVDVGHHHLSLDRGLDLDEHVLARCLDDALWLMRVDDIEFGLADTRYLLAALRLDPRPAPSSLPGRGRLVTTAGTAALLHALRGQQRDADSGCVQAPAGARR